MARGSKRQRKKNLKKQQTQYLQSKNITTKNLSYNDIQQLYTKEKEKESKQPIKRPKRKKLSEAEKRQRKQQRKDRLRKEKFEYLVSKGILPETIKSSDLNKSWDFIKGYENRFFDFNKVYSFKDNNRMYIAYRDFSGERSFAEILSEFKNLTDNELLERLTDLVNTPPIHTGKGSGSSGSAGDYKLMVADQSTIEIFNTDTRRENKKKSKRQHSGDRKGYQVLKSNGRVSFGEYTPRKMLEVMCAIMGNVTEMDRTGFYNNMYAQIKYHNPEFANILPTPRY